MHEGKDFSQGCSGLRLVDRHRVGQRKLQDRSDTFPNRLQSETGVHYRYGPLQTI